LDIDWLEVDEAGEFVGVAIDHSADNNQKASIAEKPMPQ